MFSKKSCRNRSVSMKELFGTDQFLSKKCSDSSQDRNWYGTVVGLNRTKIIVIEMIV